jgi:hypothetical protein
MPYKTLKEVRSSFLSFIIPDIQYIIFTTSHKITWVWRYIEGSYWTTMTILYFSKENPFITKKTIKPNFTIFCNNKQIAIAISKTKGANDILDIYLMLYQKWFCIINYYIISVLSDNSKFLTYFALLSW